MDTEVYSCCELYYISKRLRCQGVIVLIPRPFIVKFSINRTLCTGEVSKLYYKQGAYVALGIKVISYLMFLQISISERRTFHQIQLQLIGERHTLIEIIAHFHQLTPKDP